MNKIRSVSSSENRGTCGGTPPSRNTLNVRKKRSIFACVAGLPLGAMICAMVSGDGSAYVQARTEQLHLRNAPEDWTGTQTRQIRH